jgi:galactokinase/galacturonokinase
MLCEIKFKETYKKDPVAVAFCPYRVCPLGAHTDHQFGKVTGFAIDKGINIAYAPKQNGVIELSSLQFNKRAQWHVNSTPENKENDWADYLRGATIMLSKKYRLKVGLSGVIEGSLSIGGLSSSAAVTIAFLSALCKVNDINVSEEEMILLAQSAENEYVGVSCGKLDQSCEVFSKKGKLLYLDTKESSFELVESGKNIKPYKIVIIFSGLSRSLGSTKYNMRVDECRSAAYALMAFSGVEYGKFKDACLRDVPFETYVKYKDRLPLAWQKRAEHFYTEQARVERGVKAWRDGDIETFGKLCFESGKSSIDNYETGSLELIKLYEIMLKTKGVYGGRFSGAGFKGCCMAIIDPSFENEIKENITKEYLEIFPQYKDKFSIHICDTADGVKL